MSFEQGFTTTSLGTLISAAALDGSPTGTIVLRRNYSKIILLCELTFDAATDVQVAYEGSFDGTTFGVKTSRALSAGAGALNSLVDTFQTGSASVNFLAELDVRGLHTLKITCDGTSATVDDVLTVTGVAIVGN